MMSLSAKTSLPGLLSRLPVVVAVAAILGGYIGRSSSSSLANGLDGRDFCKVE